DIRSYIKTKKKIIDKALDGYLPSARTKPAELHKAIRYSVFSGGKRIRPVLTIACFEACNGRGNSILPVACAMELIHTYTLVHDDLPCMDDDDFRRGRSSCHKKFSEAIALLTGDALLTSGFQCLSGSGNIDIIREVAVAVGSQGTIGGQAVDIESRSANRVAHSVELDYIAGNKTAALFEAACKAGAIFSKAGKEKTRALGDFGKNLGMTFQMVDDLMDKDGYVKAYGEPRVKKMARLFTDRAKESLKIFGKSGEKLSEIAGLILLRKS
ncbi:MAG TPA: polyprenyl synthetase family protein, partial [Candidatus Omnitrophica bacterium]|nr:polyprenyl synthetase family protein [Candidatus Omnitrophota bacterium]